MKVLENGKGVIAMVKQEMIIFRRAKSRLVFFFLRKLNNIPRLPRNDYAVDKKCIENKLTL